METFQECRSSRAFVALRNLAFWGNDGVHRVAAGGSSKNRKPAGRNSGATHCYCASVYCIIVHRATGSMPFTNRSHQTKRRSHTKTAIKSPLPSTGHEEAFCGVHEHHLYPTAKSFLPSTGYLETFFDVHNHYLHRPRNRSCRALQIRKRSCDVHKDHLYPTAQSPLSSTANEEAFSDDSRSKNAQTTTRSR